MLIITIANISAADLTLRFQSAGIAATVWDIIGTCAPWPIEQGASAMIHCDTDSLATTVQDLVADTCRDLGEQFAAVFDLGGSFYPIEASDRPSPQLTRTDEATS